MSDSTLRELERAAALGDQTAVDRLAALRRRIDQPMVRQTAQYGGCRILGGLVRETLLGFTYRTETGTTKTVRKTRRERYAGARVQIAHLDPCSDCPEKRDPNACIHGRSGGWGSCETCMSM